MPAPVYIITRGHRFDTAKAAAAQGFEPVAVVHNHDQRQRAAPHYARCIVTNAPTDDTTIGPALQREQIRRLLEGSRTPYLCADDNIQSWSVPLAILARDMADTMRHFGSRIVATSIHRQRDAAVSHRVFRAKTILCRPDLPPWEPDYAEDDEMAYRLAEMGDPCPCLLSVDIRLNTANPEGGVGSAETRRQAKRAASRRLEARYGQDVRSLFDEPAELALPIFREVELTPELVAACENGTRLSNTGASLASLAQERHGRTVVSLYDVHRVRARHSGWRYPYGGPDRTSSVHNDRP